MTNDIIDDTLDDDRNQHPGRRMTEEEFVEWCDAKTKAEWVDGEVLVMSPVTDPHSNINGWLLTLIRLFVEANDFGLVRGPEFQVRLAAQKQRREPDVLFVSKNRKDLIRHTYVDGPPDLIIEIVSPESVARDWREKYIAYKSAGVREYWVIDPSVNRMEVYALRNGDYALINPVEGAVRSEVLPGFFIKPEWLWQDPLPKVAGIIKTLGIVL